MYFNNLKTIISGGKSITEDKRDDDGILSKIRNVVFSRKHSGFFKLNFLKGKIKNLKLICCQRYRFFFISENKKINCVFWKSRDENFDLSIYLFMF